MATDTKLQLSKNNFNAFIDFYNRHNVIPVSQNIENLAEFIFRREYLYTKLGVPLPYFRGRSVLEFGPGGGFNAIATSFYKPELYVFVDASNASIKKLNSHNSSGAFNANKVEIINSNIYDYHDSREYDYVIIEGAICGQDDPRGMINHVSKFVGNGGTLLTTATSATSVLSEVCRKLLRLKISECCQSFESQVSMGSNIFKSHLESLGTLTRPIEDWVIDVILNDWERGKYVFTLIDLVESIGDRFNFYNSSPSFVTDDRWYKKVTGNSLSPNSNLVQQYANVSAFFIDYRISLDSVLKIKSDISEIEKLSALACSTHDEILLVNSYDQLDDFFKILSEIKNILPTEFNLTKLAIEDFIFSLPRFIENPNKIQFSTFSQWWGRGQQYVSFIKAPC